MPNSRKSQMSTVNNNYERATVHSVKNQYIPVRANNQTRAKTGQSLNHDDVGLKQSLEKKKSSTNKFPQESVNSNNINAARWSSFGMTQTPSQKYSLVANKLVFSGS